LRTRVIFIFILLSFSVISNLLAFNQDTIVDSRFQEVDLNNLVNNPENYEEKEISFSEQILNINFNSTTNNYILTTDRGLILLIPSIEGLNTGMQAHFRGKSLQISMGYIEVYDFHNAISISILLSVPGILVFILLFFSVYKIDWKHLSFISRREENA
jgi:hypothetical protein